MRIVKILSTVGYCKLDAVIVEVVVYSDVNRIILCMYMPTSRSSAFVIRLRIIQCASDVSSCRSLKMKLE